jgi:Pentapeptide repeats (8 copies)
MSLERSSVILPRVSALLIAAISACAVLQPSRAHAQWWSRAPADFEECADKAEKAATKDARAFALSECNAKFAGRRKSGGGYTYFDFMQNRSFDIAGPNPTALEQKKIDEQYTAYLDRERQSRMAAEVTAKQQELQLQLQQASLSQASMKQASLNQASLNQASLKQASLQQASLQQASSKDENASAPLTRPAKPRAVASQIRSRTKAPNCTQHSFSCDWPRLSEGIDNLKKALFGSAPSKPKRS